MLSGTLVSLKILTGTFGKNLSYEKILIIAKDKELSDSQKAPIVNLWKDGENYRNIASKLNIPFTTISSFIATLKRHNIVENKKNMCS